MVPPLNTRGLLLWPSDPWLLGQMYATDCWSRLMLEAGEIRAFAVPGWPELPHWGFSFQEALREAELGFCFVLFLEVKGLLL